MQGGLVIRPAAPSDIPAIRALLVETWHHTYDRIFGADRVTEITDSWHAVERLEAQVGIGDAPFLVALQGDHIVGTVSIRRRSGESADLLRLYVRPQSQGQGIGRALLYAGLAAAGQPASVSLEVERDNGSAIRFYRRIGFRPRDAAGGRRPGTDDGSTGVSMIWHR